MMLSAKWSLVLFAVSVAAQSTSSSAASGSASGTTTTTSSSAVAIPSGLGLTPCIITCVQSAVDGTSCASFADITCVCSSTQFQTNARNCLTQTCTPQEVQTALGLQQSQCGAIGVSASGASGTTGSSVTGGTTTPATSAATAGSTQAQATSSPASDPNAAVTPVIGAAWALAAGILGAIVAL